MKLNRMNIRRWMLILLVLTIFGIFVSRLVIIMIIQPDYIRDRLPVGSSMKQVVKATRGEIVDRDGNPLVSNTLGYDVIIDMAQSPRGERNNTILQLIRLFQERGLSWNDSLPISLTEPFRFLEKREADVESLKNRLKIQSYTDVKDTMHHIVERYDLEGFSPEEQRLVAGVRYEMVLRDFSIENTYVFASNIDINAVLKIKELAYQLPGVDIRESALREFDRDDIAPHLIGRTGKMSPEEWKVLKNSDLGYRMDDYVGKYGIELAMEEVLRGHNGERVITLDESSRVISTVETTTPVPGNTLVLTLDSRLQQLAYLSLEAQIKVLQQTAKAGEGKEADYGAVVMLNCKTGEVLAAATYPSYTHTQYAEEYSKLANAPGNPLYNRATMGLYAPGSTFKPMVATAALGSNTIRENEVVFCGMIYQRFRDYQPKCLSTHGNIGLYTAIAQSCNIFFYDVGWRTGIDTLDEYAKAYGLGEPSGIEVGEATGHRSNPEVFERETGEKWSDGNVLQTSIGQLVALYNPVQMANYAATIGNRGQRMQVSLVKEVRDYTQQEVIQPFQPTVAATVPAAPEDFEAVVRGMVQTSRTGSAQRHFGAYPFDVASKTGTPETSSDYQNSTFICFGPAEDPEIAIFVVIEKGYHGYTAAPVARALMDEYFNVYNPNPLVPEEKLSLGFSSEADRIRDAAGADSEVSQASQAAPSAPVTAQSRAETLAEPTAEPQAQASERPQAEESSRTSAEESSSRTPPEQSSEESSSRTPPPLEGPPSFVPSGEDERDGEPPRSTRIGE